MANIINNQYIYSLCNYIVNTSQSGNTLTPTQFSPVVNACQLKYMRKLTGIPEEYKQNLSRARIEINDTESTDNSLLPFMVLTDGINDNPMPLNPDVNGIVPLPSNFFHRLSMSYWQVYNKRDGSVEQRLRTITYKTDDKWVQMIGSSLSKPKEKSPIFNIKSNYIRFYPTTIQRILFSYIRYPKNVVYDYYMNSAGGFTYLLPNTTYTLKTGEQGSSGQQAGTVTSHSTDLEWADMDCLNIISYVLSMQGVNLAYDDIIKYAEQMKNMGV